MMQLRHTILATILLSSVPVLVHAHGFISPDAVVTHENISNLLWVVVAICGAVVLVSVFIALSLSHPSNEAKENLFIIITTTAVFGTFVLIGVTFFKTVKSETNGPVHWHADFEIYNCGEFVDLIDPVGLTNRIGTSVLHEHGDNRIHVEGEVMQHHDIDLESFFDVVGGTFTDTELTVPTQDRGELTVKNGQSCSTNTAVDEVEAVSRPGKLQTFVYTVEGNTISQQKLEDAPGYLLSPETTIPPGDCIIIEFTDEKLVKTEKLCRFHQIAVNKGDLVFVDSLLDEDDQNQTDSE